MGARLTGMDDIDGMTWGEERDCMTSSGIIISSLGDGTVCKNVTLSMHVMPPHPAEK